MENEEYLMWYNHIDYTIDLKKKILSNFDNLSFVINDPLDEEIEDFILKLNKNPHIITTYSCQGHMVDGYLSMGYITFCVDEIGWDAFWLQAAPNLLRLPIVSIKCNSPKEGNICIGVYIDITTCNECVRLDVWKRVQDIFLCVFDSKKTMETEYTKGYMKCEYEISNLNDEIDRLEDDVRDLENERDSLQVELDELECELRDNDGIIVDINYDSFLDIEYKKEIFDVLSKKYTYVELFDKLKNIL